MSQLYRSLEVASQYKDRSFHGSVEEYQQRLSVSKTLYVGNLSFHTSEEQLWEVFSFAGEVRRVIMGLDSKKKTPCGFCFVEYYTHEDASKAVQWINGLKVDERAVRVDWDYGFVEGRQYGRGKTGGQIRDEWREDYDPGRGGYGSLYKQEAKTTATAAAATTTAAGAAPAPLVPATTDHDGLEKKELADDENDDPSKVLNDNDDEDSTRKRERHSDDEEGATTHGGGVEDSEKKRRTLDDEAQGGEDYALSEGE
jgi:nuclear cap-binding protein subunit 2